jgi:hypothetical protein
MNDGGNQCSTQIHHACAVQLEPDNSCPSYRSQPDHGCRIGTPDKMIRASVQSRVEQSDARPSDRIGRLERRVLAVVATLARHRQVLETIRTAR